METYYQRNREKILARLKERYANLSTGEREDIIERQKRWARENSEKIKIYKKCNALRLKEYYKKWYELNGRNRADNYSEKILEWQKEHPDRVIIARRLRYAVQTGKIIKPVICSKCGCKAKIQAHHYNYENHMNVVWLCSSCHKKEHSKESRSESS